MQDIIVFDLETKESFEAVGGYHPERLTPSVVGLYSFARDQLVTLTEEEFNRLADYFNDAALIVGFNSDHFDIPILAKYYPPLREIQSLDLLSVIKNAAGFRVKLDSVAEATMGQKKTADGLLAIKMWQEGRLAELRDYCAADVVLTRDVYLFGKQHGYVLVTSFSGPKKIAVDFNPPLQPRSNQSLSLGL